jgi:hypothetical protein
MKYIEFIKYLKSKNIILFDHDYRIAYNNINTYMITPQSESMIGGGNRIMNYDDTTLKHIIDTALSPEPKKLYWFAN